MQERLQSKNGGRKKFFNRGIRRKKDFQTVNTCQTEEKKSKKQICVQQFRMNDFELKIFSFNTKSIENLKFIFSLLTY